MSFSFMFIELPEGVLLGEGWIYDIIHPLMVQIHDTILLYSGTWLLIAARSTWYYYVIMIGLFYVGLRICMNQISAWSGAGDRVIEAAEDANMSGPEEEIPGVEIWDNPDRFTPRGRYEEL